MNYRIHLDKFLKIKETSLAEEIRLIKKEYRKYKFANTWLYPDDLKEKFGNRKDHADRYVEYYLTYTDLKSHYQHVCYVENRATSIARTYLKGRPYSVVEKPKVKLFDSNDMQHRGVWKRLCEIVAKYESREAYLHRDKRRDPKMIGEEIKAWMEA